MSGLPKDLLGDSLQELGSLSARAARRVHGNQRTTSRRRRLISIEPFGWDPQRLSYPDCSNHALGRAFNEAVRDRLRDPCSPRELRHSPASAMQQFVKPRLIVHRHALYLLVSFFQKFGKTGLTQPENGLYLPRHEQTIPESGDRQAPSRSHK